MVFFVVALIVSGVTAFMLFEIAREQVLQDLRLRVRDVVAVAARGLDGDTHARITPDSGMASSDYRAMKIALRRVRDSVDGVRFVYTIRKDAEGVLRFVVDAENDPAVQAVLDQAFDTPSPLLREAFDTLTGPLVEEHTHTDAWGAWLSGYAPFFTSDGRRAGILGLDVPADALLAYERRLLRTILMVLAGLMPLILVCGFFVGRTLARPLRALEAGAQRIAAGDLAVHLDIRRTDEIGHLAQTFNRMSDALARSQNDLDTALRQYRQIFDNASEGIFRTSLDGYFITANRALVQLLGYDTLAQLCEEVHDLGTQVYEDPLERSRLLATLSAGGRVVDWDTRLRRRDGRSVWVRLTLHLVDDDNGSKVVEGMALDVTERRQREQAERDREAARAANEAKSGFLANMSHEIRTPLNAIFGLTDLVLRTRLDERQRDHLTKVKGASRTLLAVINDILDFSKIEAGRLDLEETPFSLQEIMANLSEMFAFRAHEQDLELVVSIDKDVPGALIGDPVRLSQILINLTGNALKFTSAGEVVIRAQRDPEALAPAASDGTSDGTSDDTSDDTMVALHFSVRDTGCGIPPDRLDAVFDAFSQADSSTTRRHGGTGLGLAICRHLATLMGGEAWAESTPGIGSTFHVRVRLRRQNDLGHTEPHTPVDLRGLRVLVVEDNATSREILTHQIEAFQMTATACASGEEALARLAAPDAAYDLVLMDWKMPGMNGLEAARRIRTDLGLKRTPVVCMISAYAREDLLAQSERAFLDAFLHKPINQSFLFDTIMDLFGHQEAALSPPRALPTAAASDILPNFRGRRVLLVEDIEVNRLVAMEWLTAVELEVEVAENGRIAVDRVTSEAFDAVLMDLQMPEMDGLEATRRIRAQCPEGGPPIIAMTAHALKGDLERCLNAGMDDYVSKPIDPGRLFAALERWLPAAPAPAPAPASGDSDVSPLPSPPPASPLPDLDRLSEAGIDGREGLARANDNPRLYLKLLRGVVADHLEAAARAETEVATGRREDAQRRIHSLKGIAGNIGARDLYDAAVAAEPVLHAPTFDPTHPAWQRLRGALARLAEGLPPLVAEDHPPPSLAETAAAIVPDADLARRLAEVQVTLDDDVARATQLLEDLRPALAARLGMQSLDLLLALVNDFDLDGAIAEVERLKGLLGAND